MCCLGLMTLLASGGCHLLEPAPERYPKDLEVRVRGLVDQSRLKELVGDGEFHAPKGEVVLIDVVSRTDWVRRIREAGASLHFDGNFCDSDRLVFVVSSWLFANGRMAGYSSEVGASNLPLRDEEGRYTLHGFIYVRSGPYKVSLHKDLRIDPSQEHYDDYDLEREPRDVCVYVAGGNDARYGYISNTVRIPGGKIAAAIQRPIEWE